MFTGLITAVGTVQVATRDHGGLELTIDVPWDDLALGESIAVDGACLTVTGIGEGWFRVHLIATSLERTAFRDYAPGRRVNLERALRAGDRLGGHLVQGHVDGVGSVLTIVEREDAVLIDLAVPPAVAAVTIPLGSITVDGISMTVNAIPAPGVIQLAIIPFTLRHTTLGDRRPGDRLHVEGDTVGKYVRELSKAWHSAGAE